MALSLRLPVRFIDEETIGKGVAGVRIRPDSSVHVTQLPAQSSGGGGDALKVMVLDDHHRYARVVQPRDIEFLVETELTEPVNAGFEANAAAEQAILSWVQTGDRPRMRYLVEWLLARLVMVSTEMRPLETGRLLFWHELDSLPQEELPRQRASYEQNNCKSPPVSACFRSRKFEPDAAKRVSAWRIQQEVAEEDGGDEAFIDAKEKIAHTQKVRRAQKREAQVQRNTMRMKTQQKLDKIKNAQLLIRQEKEDAIETTRMNALSASIELDGRREKVLMERQSKQGGWTTAPNGSERVRYVGVEHIHGPYMGAGPVMASSNSEVKQRKAQETMYVYTIGGQSTCILYRRTEYVYTIQEDRVRVYYRRTEYVYTIGGQSTYIL
jgi:hypothetical protein